MSPTSKGLDYVTLLEEWESAPLSVERVLAALTAAIGGSVQQA
jgi:hypothetical protein